MTPINHRFQCRCGTLSGHLSQPHRALRGVCYCKDCRAFAHHLGAASWTHDSLGGAEFVAAQAQHVSFTSGFEHLACLSLTEKGLLRWYAKCCNTPICNTARNWKVPYVGMIGTCMKTDSVAFERSFPRVQMRVNTGSAKQVPPSMRLSTVVSLAGFIPRVMLSSISGAYRQTPFFDQRGGAPVGAVVVLSEADRASAYSAA
ncbi:DUF6151 family protein [Acidovorax sp. NO-1]|uniref:DUF6151 family protein n=1 Tax=Acidovorax sp. NO-1 TaxID=512030 RepID=UPI000A2EE7B2|nr:DUF6151 family protein [Acidovorax sp. NO-1]